MNVQQHKDSNTLPYDYATRLRVASFSSFLCGSFGHADWTDLFRLSHSVCASWRVRKYSVQQLLRPGHCVDSTFQRLGKQGVSITLYFISQARSCSLSSWFDLQLGRTARICDACDIRLCR